MDRDLDNAIRAYTDLGLSWQDARSQVAHDRRARIYRARAAGATFAEIARRMGIGRERVRDMFERAQRERKRPNPSPLERELAAPVITAAWVREARAICNRMASAAARAEAVEAAERATLRRLLAKYGPDAA